MDNQAKAASIAEEMITIYVNEYSKLKKVTEVLLEACRLALPIVKKFYSMRDGKLMGEGAGALLALDQAIAKAEGR